MLHAATATSIIYGINHTIAKDLMPYVIEPYGFIFLRISGAAALFWLFSIGFPNEKIEKSDMSDFSIFSLGNPILNSQKRAAAPLIRKKINP